jgi:hypothetical protein
MPTITNFSLALSSGLSYHGIPHYTAPTISLPSTPGRYHTSWIRCVALHSWVYMPCISSDWSLSSTWQLLFGGGFHVKVKNQFIWMLIRKLQMPELLMMVFAIVVPVKWHLSTISRFCRVSVGHPRHQNGRSTLRMDASITNSIDNRISTWRCGVSYP